MLLALMRKVLVWALCFGARAAGTFGSAVLLWQGMGWMTGGAEHWSALHYTWSAARNIFMGWAGVGTEGEKWFNGHHC